MKKANRKNSCLPFGNILVVKRNAEFNFSIYFVSERTEKRDRNVKCGKTTGNAAYYDQY